ncbi:hypothetical protein NDU88_002728 [Pleurodeles waltl]|uniref:Uncharacterized protein n=1 Tax=Pleurodeles waltl TaxID=8319 RepID=A0AAV7T2T7_PLEWA|nr:hypothetical protein NDU88_002728 [Pleurodeles waltl]
MQLESQGFALDQEQEQVLVALAMEDGGRKSYGRCSERDSETRAAESVKIDSAGSSTTVLVDKQSHRKCRRTSKGQQSALESPRMESEPRGPQRRKGQEPLQESSHHRRPSGEHLTTNNELGDRRVPGSGIPEGKSDYFIESSLMFPDYTLPDVPCSPVAKGGPCGPSKVLPAAEDSPVAAVEAAFGFKPAINRSLPSGGICLTDSIYQHISACQSSRNNLVTKESPTRFYNFQGYVCIKQCFSLDPCITVGEACQESPAKARKPRNNTKSSIKKKRMAVTKGSRKVAETGSFLPCPYVTVAAQVEQAEQEVLCTPG